MTQALKTWLAERGLSAIDIARKSGIKRRDLYRMLDGSKAVPFELKYTLTRIYGMTDAEYREAFAKAR